MIPENVKTIVFDLGGVIVNLDTSKSSRALMDLSLGLTETSDELFDMHADHFWKHERGEIPDEEFRAGLRTILNNSSVSNRDLDAAWNQMILDIPEDRIEMLKRLRTDYQLIVLSNTNQIHIDALTKYINEDFQETGLEAWFDVIYYSHQTGYRKPEVGIYKKVTEEQQLIPAEIFFIDDNPENIEAARSQGWQVQLLKSNTLNPENY